MTDVQYASLESKIGHYSTSAALLWPRPVQIHCVFPSYDDSCKQDSKKNTDL